MDAAAVPFLAENQYRQVRGDWYELVSLLGHISGISLVHVDHAVVILRNDVSKLPVLLQISWRINLRETAVRICLGDAATGDSGFVKLVEDAPKTIVIEGCFMHCGTQIMKTRIADFDPEIVEASQFLICPELKLNNMPRRLPIILNA